MFGKVSGRKWGGEGAVEDTPFGDYLDNYYMTDAISRSSTTMAKCSTAYNPVKFTNFQKIRQQL